MKLNDVFKNLYYFHQSHCLTTLRQRCINVETALKRHGRLKRLLNQRCFNVRN